MNRREFNATALAAALVPSWLIGQQRKRAIDLTPFCADQSWSRFDMSRPFHQDGLTYATEGHIAVRTKLVTPEAGDKETKLPPASKLPWWAVSKGRWSPWPKERYVVRPDGDSGWCYICNGRGRIGPTVKKCVRCKGTGYMRAERYALEYEEACTACEHQTGYVGGEQCHYCRGDGYTRNPTVLRVGPMFVGAEFDRKIRTLGDVEFRIEDEGHNAYGHEAGRICVFRFDGGEGLVMGVDCEVAHA